MRSARLAILALTLPPVVALILAGCGNDDEPAETEQSNEVEENDAGAEPPTPRLDSAGNSPSSEAADGADSGPVLFDYGTGTGAEAEDDDTGVEELYPDVVDAIAEQAADGSWSFAVTLSSPYDSAERYADAWRVLAPDGTELGLRVLTHHHADEQPFTRSLAGIRIPEDIDEVTIQGRDQVSGWGGATLDLALAR